MKSKQRPSPPALVRPLRLAFLLVLQAAFTVHAQAPFPIYTDNLVNGFQDWSWAQRDMINSTPVHSGSRSIRVTSAQWEALAFYHPALDTSLYSALSFWANGGSSGGQVLQAIAYLDGKAQPGSALGALPTNSWRHFSVPLASLGAAGRTNLDRLVLQLTSKATSTIFFVDDVELTARPAPALVHLVVDVEHPLRTVDARWLGLNTAVWDTYLDTPETIAALREAGTRALRFPGGSLSDEYHWGVNRTGTNTWTWGTSFSNFAHVATNIGAQAIITVNYGTGTPAEAASWVRHSNLTNHFAFKYWEIGNECYGDWETDSNTYPHDPYTYGVRAAAYLQQMKAADPSIRVGVVATPGDTSSSNGYTNHSVINPRTGQTVNGWTPVVLSTLKTLGVTPDFLIHHRYPEYTDQESDPFLLQCSTAWAVDAADLRQQINDFTGPNGTNIELLVTENNSNAGAQGKQSTSLVNALYLADSVGQLMKTEFNSCIWWDLRNGRDTTGLMDPILYGWRLYGDLGIMDGRTNRYPTFYTAKLVSHFARAGDSVLAVSSDYALLGAYATRTAAGAVQVVVINKDPAVSLNALVELKGFTPNATASSLSYGVPQDDAARTGTGSPDLAEGTISAIATTFTNSFGPYSATLITIPPAGPALKISAQPGFTLWQIQITGQPGAQYVLQASSDLTNWNVVSTNLLMGPASTVSLPASGGTAAQYWRALWQP